MKNTIGLSFEQYDSQSGVLGDWDAQWMVNIKISENSHTCILSWNKEWLLSLAQHLVSLAQDGVPKGSHFHFDDLYLGTWSDELIIERI